MEGTPATPGGVPAKEVGRLLEELAAGDHEGRVALALRLLVGREAPFAPRTAVDLLRRSAAFEHPRALSVMATLHATGGLVPQDWNAALDHLEHAAVRGDAFARGQLAALSGQHSSARLQWGETRRAIDTAAWLEPPPRASLCEAPRIRSSAAFAPPAVCRWLIAQAAHRLERSGVYDGQRVSHSSLRTSTEYVFDLVSAGVVMALVRAKAAALMRLSVLTMEPPQVFHYAEGEEFQPHFDHIRSAGPDQPERIATFLLYLNDDYEGGHLLFPRAGLRHRGAAGDAVYFANVNSDQQPDPLALHAGLPVLRGRKWLLSQWVRDRSFVAGSTQDAPRP